MSDGWVATLACAVVLAFIGLVLFAAKGCQERDLACVQSVYKTCSENHGSDCALTAKVTCGLPATTN